MKLMQLPRTSDQQASNRLRLNTLIRLRWLAIVGQSAAVLIVGYGFNFPLPVSLCFLLIAASAWLNVVLALRYPAAHRLGPLSALGILMFDAIQLAGLLYLTGGLTNPFSVLMTVPVVISATSLPIRLTAIIGGFVVAAATFLMFFHMPLPWYPGNELAMPFIYVAGMWVAVVSSIAFTGVYAWRVAEEARLLANALNATELVLQREQHLSAIDGLAAAAAHELGTPLATIALVAREMERTLGSDTRYREDVTLLRSQSERCREILKRLNSLSSEMDTPLMRLPLTSMIEEVIAPHRDFGIKITLEPLERGGREPVGQRKPGVIYGLGNLVENAVDFAKANVWVRWRWNDAIVSITITDDGPGFLPDIIDRIGEPYMSTRQGTEPGGGLGLGLFIAKTLLERSGAALEFRNSSEAGEGAVVEITWSRDAFAAPEAQAEEAAS
ncbi:ActS/PrrB/RegB family redox-sensitive histidine kinase [Mesorhizobium sp. BAC0120]|uniref:ActS/PrrB/RegB family redox-sensitive histidine kinase n=1 Tax=Mesorhizobium sp. BAC0120 TaxID=3090670 RepID=UPI00298BD4E2|nr:ActS/PrrB/RegB family redox-sensitive histidine kinase [Mesorhizobium sp. BAC0120]MDW6024701.1 ActS/PrrB/RegB family redox-sensitive histidine kinase [Mesorhizobium sp. BAC0120]